MYRVLAVLVIILSAGMMHDAYSQEVQLATFRETAQILVDRTLSGNITASITLQSTSNQEIKIPSELDQKIRDDKRIISVILTSQEGCGVPGVVDQSCILVNIIRSPEDSNIIKIQESAKKSGDDIIDELNELFDTKASYHSSFVHHKDDINVMLGTSGAVSGRDIVSATYTMPKEDTQSMYQKITALTLDRSIRDSGGFYNTALSLASHENSHMTLSILPMQTTSLFQISVSSDYPGAVDTNRLDPLYYLQSDMLERSSYFAGGFYPLNSILQIVLLSPEEIIIHDVNSNIIPTRIVDGDIIPTEFDQNGWIFDQRQSTKIEGKYIFGTNAAADRDELKLTYGSPEQEINYEESFKIDESIAIIAIITVFAVAAAGFYLKGYKRS